MKKADSETSDLDWVTRVNRSWLVRSNLNENAEAWLEYLADLGDGRLPECCASARAMCGIRNPYDDPKPWFYGGLFHLATVAEAGQFLETHRITKATVVAMVDDESVQLWLDRVGPETRDLLERLRAALAKVAANS